MIETTPLPRFGLHAERYHRRRLAYGPEVFVALLDSLGAGRNVAVDLGAGTGPATGYRLGVFDRVIAVEPDAEMAALIPPDPRLEVRIERAEETVCAPGSVDAVIAATAFHWMDQPLITRKAYQWLRPGGVFFAFAYDVVGWRPAGVQEAVHRRHGEWKSCMHARLTTNYDYADEIRRAGLFADVQALRAVVEQPMTPEEAAGFLMTTSYASLFARKTGDEAAYEAGLEAEIAEAARTSGVVARFPMVGALAVKRG